MTNEQRLVLSLSRITFDDVILREIEEIGRESVSWDSVYLLALYHGVAPLLYHNMKKLDLGGTSSVRSRLEPLYWITLAQNIRLYQELEHILKRLAQEGIEAIVLKGIPICRRFYGDLGLRPSGDIDLLIQVGDLDGLEHGVRSMGYLPTHEDLRALVRRNWFKAGFLKQNGFPVTLEVHWNWAQPTRARANMNLAWQRSEREVVDDLVIRLLSPEDTFLYLCTHLSYHSFDLRLIWLCDLHEIINRYRTSLDWGYVCREAGRQRIQTPVFVACDYLRRMFKASIPTTVLEEITIGKARRRYLNAFLNSDSLRYFRYPKSFLKQELFRLFLVDHPLDRVKFCLHVLKNQKLPSFLSP